MKEKFQRLANILERLYNGEELRIGELAKEYKTSTKTIQRDFKERLKSSMLVREGNRFRLKSSQKAQRDAFVLDILENLAKNIGGVFAKDVYEILGQYRALKHQIFPPFKNQINQTKHILKIENAIKKNYTLDFFYHSKEYKKITPLSLCAFQASLFLYAQDKGEARLFEVGEISQCRIKTTKAIYQTTQCQTTQSMISLFVYPQASTIAQTLFWGENQTFIQDKDGSLIVEFSCLNEEALIQTILSQIPNIVILEPQSLKEKLENKIFSYMLCCGINEFYDSQ